MSAPVMPTQGMMVLTEPIRSATMLGSVRPNMEDVFIMAIYDQ
jgi:hypothetical protein